MALHPDEERNLRLSLHASSKHEGEGNRLLRLLRYISDLWTRLARPLIAVAAQLQNLMTNRTFTYGLSAGTKSFQFASERAFLVGVAGAKWITNEVDKRLLKESVKVAASGKTIPME